MRFVTGTDVRRLLKSQGPLDANEAAEILDKVAGALDAAHARGLVHRDVKPANSCSAPTARSSSPTSASLGTSRRWTR